MTIFSGHFKNVSVYERKKAAPRGRFAYMKGYI